MRSEVTIAQLSGQMSCSQNFSEPFADPKRREKKSATAAGKLPWINCKACNAALRPGVLDVYTGPKQLEIEQQRVDLRFAVIQKLCLQKLDAVFRNYCMVFRSYSVVFRNYSSYSETVRNYFGIYRNYSVVFRNYRLGLGSL